jgi:hypothetical protein
MKPARLHHGLPILDETQVLIPIVESTQKDVQPRANKGNFAALKNRRFESITLTGEEASTKIPR